MKLPAAFLNRPIAHRGLHDQAAGVIENSRAAFVAAIDAGYGIELDLQASSDGEAMVFHDYELARLTGAHGFARSRTAAELRALRLAEGDEGIPTFAEILTLVAGRAPLLIEVKDQSARMAPTDGVLERRVAALLAGYDGPVALMAFNPHSVTHLGVAAPDRPRGRVTGAFRAEHWAFLSPEKRAELARIDDLAALGACFISHQHHDLARPLVQDLRRDGTPVLTWTIRTEAEAAAARPLSDNITFEGIRP